MTAPTITLHGPRVVLRPGIPADAPRLRAIRLEPEVLRWWRAPESVERIAAELHGEGDETQFVVELGGRVAGLVQYVEENEPDYRHAAIDIFLSHRARGRGIGSETVALLAAHLIDERAHHRLTIDPSASNAAAIACYTKVGFRPVGLMRQYERDGGGGWRDGLLMDLLAAELVRAPRQARTRPDENL